MVQLEFLKLDNLLKSSSTEKSLTLVLTLTRLSATVLQFKAVLFAAKTLKMEKVSLLLTLLLFRWVLRLLAAL